MPMVFFNGVELITDSSEKEFQTHRPPHHLSVTNERITAGNP